MSGIDRLLQNAFGPVAGTFIVTGSETLGTTVAKISLPVVESETVFRLKIVNANSGSGAGNFAYKLVDRDSATPTFVANAGSTGGSLVLPASYEYITVLSSKDLYVVGQQPNTKWQITINFLS